MPVPLTMTLDIIVSTSGHRTGVEVTQPGLVIAMLHGYIKVMSVVKVSVLKNRLSHYLRLVRRGETVLVSDRDQVIARIEPAGDLASTGADDSGWLDDLERRGVVRRGAGKLPRGWLVRRPAVAADLVGALLDERRDGR